MGLFRWGVVKRDARNLTRLRRRDVVDVQVAVDAVDHPDFFRTVGLCHFHVNPGVRIDPLHSHDFPLQQDRPVRIEFSAERVVRHDRHGCRRYERHQHQCSSHISFNLRLGPSMLPQAAHVEITVSDPISSSLRRLPSAGRRGECCPARSSLRGRRTRTTARRSPATCIHPSMRASTSSGLRR